MHTHLFFMYVCMYEECNILNYRLDHKILMGLTESILSMDTQKEIFQMDHITGELI